MLPDVIKRLSNLHSDFHSYHRRHGFAPIRIQEPVPEGLAIVVVIPCHGEPDLIHSLESLRNCKPVADPVEVIIVVNAGEEDQPEIHSQNQATLLQAEEWIQKNKSSRFNFFLLDFPSLPQKHAGVGLARKIGMDEAANRLCRAGNESGIIACFDADSTCEPNYLQELTAHFQMHPASPACSIRFEHPLSGELAPEIYSGITRYELYLRYYRIALRFAGHPHAYQAIGSSMAVRANAYMEQGGMNRRKAGEDFYFLHKYIPLGNFSELNSTCIFPSPRPSNRVPFGTGRAMNAWLSNPVDDYPVLSFQSFLSLKILIDKIPQAFRKHPDQLMENLPPGIIEFLNLEKHRKQLQEVYSHTTSLDSFQKRFFRWFNGLMALQYFHFMRDHYHSNEPLLKVCRELLLALNFRNVIPENEMEMLVLFREIEYA